MMEIPAGPAKPAWGSPCNGCGLCCVAVPCRLALSYADGVRLGQPCPALEWDGERAFCGLVRRPFHHSTELRGIPALAAAAGVPEVTEEDVRAVMADILGGIGGSCDSGFASRDEYLGVTAAEFQRRREA